MGKMLWELKAPLVIAKAKEDMGLNNIFKYLRYYRMFIERSRWTLDKVDLTNRIENLLFWRGKLAFINDKLLGLIVCEIVNEKKDPNGTITEIDVTAENGYKKKGLKVGKDAVIMYADETYFAPVLYIWSIANEIIDREDIIKQQDNMLRKPILVTGEGEELDNAMAKMMNILSGVQWFNLNPKKKGDNIALDKPAEVLNLQVGNAYKGKELWESRGKFEELIRDYLGYKSCNNEKKERMIQAEVNETNSVCDTFYNSSVKMREQAQKDVNEVLGKLLKYENMLNQEKEEVIDNGNKKDKME